MSTSRHVILVVALLGLTSATAQAQAEMMKSARVLIFVPIDAVVYVDEIRMQSTGNERLFESPPLPQGIWYSYQIDVVEDGQRLRREIHFQAGQTVQLDFRPLFRQLWEMDRPASPRRPLQPWLSSRRWYC